MTPLPIIQQDVERYVPEEVVLGFRPDEATDDGAFQRVWADPHARIIWVAWKWKHIVNQKFEEDCLYAAAAFREGRALWLPRYGPGSHGSNFYCDSHDAFVEQVLPVLRGERSIRVG